MSQQLPQTWLGKTLNDLGLILGAVRQFFRPRYVRYLEREVERLRAENIALWNSLVGTAGVPPPVKIADSTPSVKLPVVPKKRTWPQYLRHREEQSRTEHRQTLMGLREKLKQERAQKGNGAEKSSSQPAGSEP